MTRKIKALAGVLLALTVVLSIWTVPVSAAPAISKTSVTMIRGTTTTLSISGTSQKVRWYSSNKSIAAVNSSGKVLARGVGSTNINAQVGTITLKCRVTVTAGTISTNLSSTTLEKGQTKGVTVTAKGSKAVSISSSNKSVATASWDRPARWDGDKINFTIRAVGAGTATIRVYLTSYPNSVYKTITVTVKAPPEDEVVIVPLSENVEINVGETSSFRVYTSIANAVNVAAGNTGVATVSTGTSSGNYTTVNVRGVAAGTTTVRISSKTKPSNYAEVKVTVKGSSSQYYKVEDKSPQRILSSDKIISYTVGSVTRYMLIPADGDLAYANTVFSSTVNVYDYYKVYSASPPKKLSTDTVYSFWAYVGGRNETRYILRPQNYDEGLVNSTEVAYTNEYYYYTIYNTMPTRKVSSDKIEQWSIIREGKTLNRYMLVPVGGDAQAKTIIDKDKADHATYQHYVTTTTKPTTIQTGDVLVTWNVSGIAYYMVMPASEWKSRIDTAHDTVAWWSAYYCDNAYKDPVPMGATNGVQTPITIYRLEGGTSTYGVAYMVANSNSATGNSGINSRIEKFFKNGMSTDMVPVIPPPTTP